MNNEQQQNAENQPARPARRPANEQPEEDRRAKKMRHAVTPPTPTGRPNKAIFVPFNEIPPIPNRDNEAVEAAPQEEPANGQENNQQNHQ